MFNITENILNKLSDEVDELSKAQELYKYYTIPQKHKIHTTKNIYEKRVRNDRQLGEVVLVHTPMSDDEMDKQIIKAIS